MYVTADSFLSGEDVASNDEKFKCSVSTGFCLLEFLRTFGQAAPQFKHLAR